MYLACSLYTISTMQYVMFSTHVNDFNLMICQVRYSKFAEKHEQQMAAQTSDFTCSLLWFVFVF